MTESSQTNEFLRLLMANQKRIYAFILATVPNRQDADDLFQETVLLMWSKFDDFQRGTSFVAWGITVAKYQILSVRSATRCGAFSSVHGAELLHSESDGSSNRWTAGCRPCASASANSIRGTMS